MTDDDKSMARESRKYDSKRIEGTHRRRLMTQLADMDTRGQQWPASFEYHCVLQQKRDCIEALAALEAAAAQIQLSFPFSGDGSC